MGRRHELAALVGALPAIGEAGALHLIRGEPGAGKTRLAEELALAARARGVATVVGRSWDRGDAPLYWPWVHALRSLPGHPRTSSLAELVMQHDAAGTDRFALFDATAALLASATDDAPLVVVLDDLHDADIGSLLLARFVARELDRLPLLLVATYRPVEAARRRQIADHLGALEREGTAIDLRGLSVDEVAELIGDASGADDIHRRTGGNPLFVLHHRDRPSLRGAIRFAIDPVGADVRTTLAAIAILGPAAATPARVAALTGSGATRTRGHLDDAIEAGLLRPVDGTGELNLTHPLVGEVLVAELTEDERAHWHVAAASQLADDPEHRVEVARHLVAAGAGHEADAFAACRRSAAQATGALVHEEAVDHLETALALLDHLPGDTRRDRCDVLLELGAARWRASLRPAAEEAFAEATELAVDLGDASAQAAAALGGGYRSEVSGDDLVRRAERLHAALDSYPPGDDPVRVRLLADLVTNELPALEQAEAIARADDIVAMARRVDDPTATGYALVARQVVELGPSSLASRLTTSREVLASAERSGDRGLALQGRFHLVGALLEAGDLRAIDVELAAHSRAIDEIAEPAYARHERWFATMRLIVAGRADDAEDMAEQGLVAAEEASDPDALLVYGGQLGVIRWLQGRVGEMEPLWVDVRRADPGNPVWTATLAWLWATTGQIDAARGAVQAVGDLEAVDHDRHWLLTMTALAEAVALAGDTERADDLRSRLLPYAGRVVPIAMGISWWGTVARPLGLLAGALGRYDEAERHLSSAIELTGRLGARPWLAQVQLDLAELDLTRGQATSSTARLVAEATSTIESHGPLQLRDRSATLAAALPATAPNPEPATALTIARSTIETTAADTDRRPRVVVLGAFEVTAADGTVARWTSRKARQLLKVLVARRGSPVAREQLMEVLWPGEDPEELSNRLSVALSTVRRALDPARSHAADQLIAVDGDSVRLRLDHVDVDVEELLAAAATALAQLREAERTDSVLDTVTVALGQVMALHRGDAIADEPYADWAEPLRAETRSAMVSVARELARLAEADGDDLLAVAALRRVLESDPYDEPAHLGLIRVFDRLGAHGQAHQARRGHRSAMIDLGGHGDGAPGPTATAGRW